VGCNCGSKKKQVAYEANGVKYGSIAEAQKACKGCAIKAVPA
jgi:hypothetical protein